MEAGLAGAATQQPDAAALLQQGSLAAEPGQHSPSPSDECQPDTQLPPTPPSPQGQHSSGLAVAPSQGPSLPASPNRQQRPAPAPELIEVVADAHGTGPDAFAAPSDFMMYVFKVLPCPHGNSHAWAQCPFLHPGEHARRRDPRVYPYIPIACPDMKRFNACPKGDACPNSHGDFEYWLHPHRYRTQLCRDGAACRRRVCFFAHDPCDLRPPTTVLAPDAHLPLVPAAMPRVIGPAAVSGMGAPGSGVVVVVGRSSRSAGKPTSGPQGPGAAAELDAATPAGAAQLSDLSESAGLFTVSAAPPAAAAPAGVAPDGGESACSGSSTSAQTAAAAAVDQQLASLALGPSSSSSASVSSLKGEGGGTLPVAAAEGPPVQQVAGVEPEVAAEADAGGGASAASTEGAGAAAGSPTAAATAAAAAPPGLEGLAAPAVTAAMADPQQQMRLATEVLDASGKSLFMHPDNLKLLDVLLAEVTPAELGRVLPRPSGAPLLRFTPSDMPEAMAACNRGPNPSSRYPGPAGTMSANDARQANRRGGQQGGGPLPQGGYGRGGAARGGPAGFQGGPFAGGRHATPQARPFGGMQQQGGPGAMPLGPPGMGQAGGSGPGHPVFLQPGSMPPQQQQQQVLLAPGAANPMYQHHPSMPGSYLQPVRQQPPQQQQQQQVLGGYGGGGALDGYGAAPMGGWGASSAPGADWGAGAASAQGAGAGGGNPLQQQSFPPGLQGVVAAGKQYAGPYPSQLQQPSYVVMQDGHNNSQPYWLQPAQQQQVVFAQQQHQQQQQHHHHHHHQQQQPYYVMQPADGMQLQGGPVGTGSSAMLVMPPSASLPYASSSSAMGLGLVLPPGRAGGGVPAQGLAQQPAQHMDGQPLYAAAANPLLQGMQYVMLPGSQAGGVLGEQAQQPPQQLPW